MGFIDDISKTITDAGQGVIQKGKELAGTAKINSLISDEEKKITRIYEQIGRKYIELHRDSSEKELKELIDALTSSEKTIEKLEIRRSIVNDKLLLK